MLVNWFPKILLSKRGINILQGEGLFRDRTAEEVSNVVGSGVNLILSRGDVEVLEQVLEDRERLSGLLAGNSRNRRGSSSRHFGRKKSRKSLNSKKRKNCKSEKKQERSKSVLLGYLDKR